MATPSADPPPRFLRLRIGPEPVAVVLLGIGVGLAAFAIATAGRRYLGWALASAIVSVLVEPFVRWLDRKLPRALAVIAAFLVLGAVIAGLGFGVLRDLGGQVERLKVAAPDAAVQLEESERFGQFARDFRLVERVEEAVAQLEDPASGVGRQAAASAGTYFLCFILTVSLLGAIPGIGRAAINQLGDEELRERVRGVAREAFNRARMYIISTLGLAVASGAVAWGLFDLEQVPASLALAVVVAAFSVVPGVGVFVGAVPALLIEAGLGTPAEAGRLAVAMLVLQLAHQLAMRKLVAPRSLVVGPAVIVIAVVLGYEVYGVGGAAYTAALAVFAVAALDAAGDLQSMLRAS